MTTHLVDQSARRITDGDLATWLLFFLESHGASVVLTETRAVHVDLNPMPGMDAATAERWAPIIVILLPRFRDILLARHTAAPLGI